MAFTNYWGPANWTIDPADASKFAWVGNELEAQTTTFTFGAVNVADKDDPRLRADRWRLTISGAQTDTFPAQADFRGPLLGTDVQIIGATSTEFTMFGFDEGVDRFVDLAIYPAGARFVSLEYDSESIRALTDVVRDRGFLVFNNTNDIFYDDAARTLILPAGSPHEAEIYEPVPIWDDWSVPPERLRIVFESPVTVPEGSIWIKIDTGYFPDPVENAVWAPIELVAGSNEVIIDLVDLPPYAWASLKFVNAGPGGTPSVVTTPQIGIHEFHLENIVVPPLPSAEYKPVNQFTLTLELGAQSVTLPMTSFSARLVSARPSFLQAVVPNAPAYIDQITPLSAGEFFVTWRLVNQATGAVIRTEEIARANLANVSSAEGPRSSSITLTGNKQQTYTALAAHELTALQQKNGDQTRLGFSADIKPADTLNGATIDAVQINATATDAYMTITTL